MLVRLALHRYGGLTNPAADDRSTAAVWAALWGVRGWRLAWCHWAGERSKTWWRRRRGFINTVFINTNKTTSFVYHKKYRKYIAWSTASPTHYIYSCSAMRTHAMKLPAHSFCADINALMRFGALQFMSQQSLLCTLALGDPALFLYIGLTFWGWAAVAPKLFHFGIILLSPNENKKCNEFVAVVESYSVSSLKGPIPKPNICKGRLLGSALLETCETKTLEFKD